jgi:pimeloyl-ACP methyl ester carboxylesterase
VFIFRVFDDVGQETFEIEEYQISNPKMVIPELHRDASSLHLPRILCLHGGGTNARIFRQQCRVLRKSLNDRFRFVFADAPFICSRPGPDVTSVYASQGPFRSWLPMFEDEPYRTPEEVVEAVDAALITAMCVDDLCGATGVHHLAFPCVRT